MKGFWKIAWMLSVICTATYEGSLAQVSGRVMVDIDNLYILPETLTCNNQVSLVAEITTRSNGSHLGYQTFRKENEFIIEDCFYVGILTVIDHFKVTIPLGNLEPGDYHLIYSAFQSKSEGKCSKDSLDYVSKELKFKVEGNLRLVFKKEWNIVSLNCRPLSNNPKDLFKSMMNEGTLVKVQDGKGNLLEDIGMFNPRDGWFNSIDSIHPAEGYKVKVNADCYLDICGTPVNYPFHVPLEKGWNLVSFPCRSEADGLGVVQQLIDHGTLVKVQDELGNSIENMGVFGGWQNFIGNLKPGKGYKIKTNAVDSLTVYEAYLK